VIERKKKEASLEKKKTSWPPRRSKIKKTPQGGKKLNNRGTYNSEEREEQPVRE